MRGVDGETDGWLEWVVGGVDRRVMGGVNGWGVVGQMDGWSGWMDVCGQTDGWGEWLRG